MLQDATSGCYMMLHDVTSGCLVAQDGILVKACHCHIMLPGSMLVRANTHSHSQTDMCTDTSSERGQLASHCLARIALVMEVNEFNVSNASKDHQRSIHC